MSGEYSIEQIGASGVPSGPNIIIYSYGLWDSRATYFRTFETEKEASDWLGTLDLTKGEDMEVHAGLFKIGSVKTPVSVKVVERLGFTYESPIVEGT